MGKGKKTAEAASGVGNVVGQDYDFHEGFDFTYCHRPDEFKHDKAKPNQASTRMKPESHPWLQFRDASKNDKIIFINKLAEIQDYPVTRPKIIDWNLLGRLGVRDDILRMIQTTGEGEHRVPTNVDMWGRIFRLNLPAHREWCLEFYSTLEVEHIYITREITEKQIIHFRLGGVQRHCTALGFAYLTGMLTAEEMSTRWVHQFILNSAFNSAVFNDDKSFDEYWLEISGLPVHNPHSSKLSQIRSKRLRILHKMITFSYLHRGDNNNKVYSDDLWLLRYFSELSPDRHVLAPYILARHMSRNREKRLLCGHFVSMIASRLGVCDRRENIGNLSSPVQVELIGELDFVKSKMLSSDKTRLLEDEEAPAPARRLRRRRASPVTSEEEEEAEGEHQQAGPQPYGFDDIRGELGRLSGRFDDFSGNQRRMLEHQEYMMEQQRYFSSLQSQMGYTMGYYRPVWQHQMEQMYQSRPNPEDRQMPMYSPPELYVPRPIQSDYPYPPYAYTGGVGGSHHVGTQSFAGGSSSGAGGAGYDATPFDPYGAELFGTQHSCGGGAPSIFDAPGEQD